MIDMIVTLQVRPGMEAKAEDLLRQLENETTENDPGCLRYQWYKAEQPCLYYLLERWTPKWPPFGRWAILRSRGTAE